ncbi:nudC domain-containing protein 2-like isoform X1 [Anneissia japonica]|uniref:nudC domain-containing protein 2-like isoform X1 n=1 Tax=Anneissia japonica TaxID=1529436 RepID=UPI00142555A6|nr:nudC domain-containing protein 2-like isoform X1 [Anneissia japonica]
MSHFDEKSGIVPCETEWGMWYQTIEEVMVEINVEPGTKPKEITVIFKPNHLTCVVRGNNIIKGDLFATVHADECLWDLEDRKLLRLTLTKGNPTAENCWQSLLKEQYAADPMKFDQMEKKLTLERFQNENPGFDFSGAEMSGNYSRGGPDLSN